MAVIVPADFSQAAFTGSGESNVVMVHDPMSTIGPLIVKQLLAQFADGFSGARITLDVAAQQMGTLDAATAQAIALQYAQWAQAQGQQQNNGQHPMLTVQAPPVKAAARNTASMMSSMMVGMLVFFAFYTAASMAQSILKEEEDGTLPRLFTTPTARATILGGKFAAIFMMVERAGVRGDDQRVAHVQDHVGRSAAGGAVDRRVGDLRGGLWPVPAVVHQEHAAGRAGHRRRADGDRDAGRPVLDDDSQSRRPSWTR